MSETDASTGDGPCLTGQLTIDRATELKQQLEEAISTSTEVVLHFSDVNEVDLSFVQLLWSARRHAEENGVRLRVALPVPDALREELTRAGFFRREDLVPVEDGEAIWTVGWDAEL